MKIRVECVNRPVYGEGGMKTRNWGISHGNAHNTHDRPPDCAKMKASQWSISTLMLYMTVTTSQERTLWVKERSWSLITQQI